jgi:hypothetical protein
VYFRVGAPGGGAGNGDGGPTIRSNLTDTFYLCDVADNTAVDRGLYKCVSGGFTQIVATFAVVTTGDVVRIEAQGTALKAYLNSVQQQSQSDSAIDGTTVGGVIPGLFLSKLGLTAETWAAGDFVTDPLTLPAPVSRFPKFRLRGGARS